MFASLLKTKKVYEIEGRNFQQQNKDNNNKVTMSGQEKPRETGKSFSISSILENNEESSKKDNTNVPAIISKLEFPENSSKNILTNPQHCFLNPLSTWYQWYAAGHQMLQHFHQENYQREYNIN